MSSIGKTLGAATAEFTRSATRKETADERSMFKNGAFCNLPPGFQDLPKGSPERAAAFAQAVGGATVPNDFNRRASSRVLKGRSF